MRPPSELHHPPDILTAYFRSGDAIRSRSVGGVVLSGQLDIPALPGRLIADCEREIVRLGLEPGDVEALALARARTRWPGYRYCVQAMSDWMDTLGLPALLASGSIALMACRGASYHHDGTDYGGAAFCNLFLSDDKDLDLHFPHTGHRMPLVRGMAVVFDTGQPHAVIRRGGQGFHASDFAPGVDCTQLFLSWELPIENAPLAQALGVRFDTAPVSPAQRHREQVCLDGVRAQLCPHTGIWHRDESELNG